MDKSKNHQILYSLGTGGAKADELGQLKIKICHKARQEDSAKKKFYTTILHFYKFPVLYSYGRNFKK